MAADTHSFDSDRPLGDPQNDALGYASFAEHLAANICSMELPHGLVIALYGPWGSGKSTVLSFIQHYIKEEKTGRHPKIVNFNPWWFSDYEDLARSFLLSMQAQLMSQREQQAKKAGELLDPLADLADAVSGLPIPVVDKGAKALAIGLGLIRRRKQDIPSLKEKVASSLAKASHRILVIIDDIDRLSADQIRQMFRVIKALADFPNVVYLLAFDRKIVVEALGEMQGIPGEKYLEKIVQVPFELPLPDEGAIESLFIKQLNMVAGDYPDVIFDREHWNSILGEGLHYFFDTPRAVVRLINALQVTYPAIKGEVNPIDFVAIETLRIFAPSVYNAIRHNKSRFTGIPSISAWQRTSPDNEERAFHNAWLEQVNNDMQKPVEAVMRHLFPKYNNLTTPTNYSADELSKWQRQLRICTNEHFSTYFRLAVPAGHITNKEMQAFIALTSNAKVFRLRLLEMVQERISSNSELVNKYLRKMRDYADEGIPTSSIENIVTVFFEIGDLLIPAELGNGSSHSPISDWMSYIVKGLLRRINHEKRYVILHNAYQNGTAVTFMTDLLVDLEQEHGHFGNSRPLLDREQLIIQEQLEGLETLFVSKLHDWAHSNNWQDSRSLRKVVACWRELTSEEEVRTWVNEISQNNGYFLDFLAGFRVIGPSSSLDDNSIAISPILLTGYLEPESIIGRVRTLASDVSLSEAQRLTARQFLLGYELYKQGKDPEKI